MRQIKFRLWDSKNNCWYEPTFEAYRGKVEEVMISPRGRLTMRTMTEFVDESMFPDRFELMQFTGLHDNNGREIYESDIVRVQETMDGGRIVCLEAIASVFWNKERGCWGCEGEFEGHLADYAFGTELNMMGNVCEVVGNIYENPELMEVAEHEN